MIDVAKAYEIWAERYDECENRTRDLDALALRASGLERTGRDIVELGCGTAKNTTWLAEGCRSLAALDMSDAMLERARARVASEHVRFVRHDLRTPWPLPASSADLVVGNLVLEHIRDLEPIFVEAARVIRPSGLLYVSEFHPFRQLLGGGAKLSEDPGARVEAYAHDVSEYVNAALDAGFSVDRVREWRDAGTDDAVMPRILTIRFVYTSVVTHRSSAV